MILPMSNAEDERRKTKDMTGEWGRRSKPYECPHPAYVWKKAKMNSFAFALYLLGVFCVAFLT